MGWTNIGYEAEPQSPDGLIAEAIKRDVCARLEQALYDDAVIATYLAAPETALTVTVEVTLDRDLRPGNERLQPVWPDNEPFAGAIGAPAVAAMIVGIRQKVARADGLPVPDMAFEVVVNPDRISLRSA